MATQEYEARISSIVNEALKRHPNERSAYLDGACAGEPEMRAQAASLLEASSGPTQNPWATTVAEAQAERQTVGPYRLVRVLGMGGMGEVWLAEQTEPVRRLVALKLIRAGMYDDSVVQRFRSERQSLALMNHPAIAKVFDAGTTSNGQPYFAMEFVDGPSITEYCDDKKLGIRERLELFIQVCEGVLHAHQKAIIHRDLKPSNILVVEVDGKPRPRIIDFGLAKAAVPALQGQTLFTHVGGFLGTPGYMSPEQADPTIHDVDTRTDVYSMGVVLYELLTGFLPFDATRWKKQRFDEVLREWRESDPPLPSTKVGAHTDTSTALAQSRGTEPGQLAGTLRGDLDWIAMKALEKERSRRYGTPSELAEDIERYLQNRPVKARPASAAYRLQKYVRRNRVAVGATTGLVILLAGFAAMQTLQLRRITRERDRADRITDFMTSMFKVSDPSESRGNTVTAREILDKSANEIESALGQDAEVQSQLMQVMAATYANLGLYSRARELAERALDIRRRTLGPNDRKTFESRNQLGQILYDEGHETEAEQSLRATIGLEKKSLGPDDDLTQEALEHLSHILGNQGHNEEREKLARELLAVATRKFGPQDQRTLAPRLNLANALRGQDRFPEAESEFRQALQIARDRFGSAYPTTLAITADLASMFQEQGRYAEAESLHRETLAIEERVFGPNHPETGSTMTTLASDLRHEAGRTAEAEAFYRKALEIETKAVGSDHRYAAEAEQGLAIVLSAEQRYAEAESLHRKILASRLRLLGPDNTDTLLSQYNVADVLYREERFAEAETIMRKTMEAQFRVLGADDPDALASKALLARILIKENRLHEAEELARQAYEVQRRRLGPQHNDTLDSLQFLGTALALDRRYDEAKALFLDDMEKIKAGKGGDDALPWYQLACVEVAAGHRDEAFNNLHKAIAAGSMDAWSMGSDDDLKPLRPDPRFAGLLAEAKSRAAVAGNATPGPVTQ